MNATIGLALARRLRLGQRLRHRQRGFALYEGGRAPGLPPRIANARGRFENEARQALRDWLML